MQGRYSRGAIAMGCGLYMIVPPSTALRIMTAGTDLLFSPKIIPRKHGEFASCLYVMVVS